MPGSKKIRSGPILVIGILLLTILGTARTWMVYTHQAPSTAEAHTVDATTVEATFRPTDAERFRPGMKAIVTITAFPQQRFLGLVDSTNGPLVRVRLDNPPENLKPALPAQVTVDTSVPVEKGN